MYKPSRRQNYFFTKLYSLGREDVGKYRFAQACLKRHANTGSTETALLRRRDVAMHPWGAKLLAAVGKLIVAGDYSFHYLIKTIR